MENHSRTQKPIAYEYHAFVIDAHDDAIKMEIDLGFGIISIVWMFIIDPPVKKDIIGKWVTIRCHKDRNNHRYYADIWCQKHKVHDGDFKSIQGMDDTGVNESIK